MHENTPDSELPPTARLARQLARAAEGLAELAAPYPDTGRLAEQVGVLASAAGPAVAALAESGAEPRELETLRLLVDRAEEIVEVAEDISRRVTNLSRDEGLSDAFAGASRKLSSITAGAGLQAERPGATPLRMGAAALRGETARFYRASSFALYSSAIVFASRTTVDDLLFNVAAVRETAPAQLGFGFLWAFRRGLPEAGFEHPVIRPVSRLICRLQWDRSPHDELSATVRAWMRSLPEAHRLPISIAKTILRAAAVLGDEASAEALLSEAGARWTDGREDDSLVRSRSPFGSKSSHLATLDQAARSNPLILGDVRSLLCELERLDDMCGNKPVRKIDYIDQGYVDLCRQHPEEFPNVTVFRSATTRNPNELDMFYGRDAADVDEAVRLTRLHEGHATSPEEMIDTTTRIGVVLGYPECCSRAFAEDQEAFRGNSESIMLARRLAEPGPVPPASKLFFRWYLPCSLTCAASVERAAGLMAFVRESCGEELHGLLTRSLETPFLMLLDKRTELMDIHPEHEVSERFTYSAGEVFGEDERLQRVREGDTMVVEEGCISILKQGRETERLCMDAFLWWNERVFHVDFWRRFLERRARRNTEQGGDMWSRSRRDGMLRRPD